MLRSIDDFLGFTRKPGLGQKVGPTTSPDVPARVSACSSLSRCGRLPPAHQLRAKHRRSPRSRPLSPTHTQTAHPVAERVLGAYLRSPSVASGLWLVGATSTIAAANSCRPRQPSEEATLPTARPNSADCFCVPRPDAAGCLCVPAERCERMLQPCSLAWPGFEPQACGGSSHS